MTRMYFDSANLQGREQHGKGRETGDKGTGSGRAGYGRREVLTSLSPLPPLVRAKGNFPLD